MKVFLLFVLVICISLDLAAQSDYGINKKGDTIRGKFKKGFFGDKWLETAEGKMDLDPREISLYHDARNNQTFCSRIIPESSRPVFLTRHIAGIINLYSYTVQYNNGRQQFSSTSWYAEKEGAGIGEIKTSGLRGGKNERKNFFRSLIADNSAVVKRFDEDKKLKLALLQELIEEYNRQAAE